MKMVAATCLEYGAPRKIRTSDRSVRSRVLYPAELWVHWGRADFTSENTKRKNGAPRKIRTSDRSVRSRVLYPAELWVHFDSYCRFYPTIFPYYISVSFCPSRSFDCKSTYALESMVHPGRFELPTARFVAEYSIQLSYGCILNGGEAGIRTPDAAFDRILP